MPIRITLAYGSAVQRRAVRAALEMAGFAVTEADCGAGALTAAREHHSIVVAVAGENGTSEPSRFRSAVAGSPVSLWTQGRDLRYTWAFNSQKLLGAADPVGRTDAEIAPGGELAALTGTGARVLQSGSPVREEVAVHAGEEIRTFDVYLQPISDEHGAVRGLAGAAVDITESKRWETRLRYTQKLESIGVLAGGIAHDFNNLLTTVLGHSTLAMEELPPGHKARPFVAAAIRGAEQAARLTSQLLAYAGRGRFVIRRVDLSELVGGILNLIHSSIPKSVRVHSSLRPNLPPVAADTAQLQQLVMNLVINAGEAIGQGNPGTIRINTGVQNLSELYIERSPLAQSNAVMPGEYAYLEVRDTGCGMDAGTKTRIFEPFFSTKFTGRGLGLAAVDGIVRAHRGTMELYSAPGRGTTFKVLFPVAAVEERREEAPPAEAQPEQAAAGCVLVADDEESVREMVRAALERRGYSVLLAEDGEAALALFEQAADTISAVILDIGMPGASAADLVVHMRRQRPGLPAVIASGSPEPELRSRFDGRSAPVFIAKPFTAEAITRALSAARAGLTSYKM